MHGQVLTHVADAFTVRIRELNPNAAACLWDAASLLLVRHLLTVLICFTQGGTSSNTFIRV